MFEIKEFESIDIEAVKKFTDEAIGLDYYSIDELRDNQKRSESNGVCTSFLLVKGHQVHGLRLAYGPGLWEHGKGAKLRPDLWNFKKSEMGYFQSLFLSPLAQGQGFGPKLSEQSLFALKKLGAKAILTHSWKESPNNASVKYLLKLGFKPIIEHPDYWIDVDYLCTRDGKPCRCTSIEMILELK